MPYFTQLIAEEVQRSLHDLPRLHLLLQVLSWSLPPFLWTGNSRHAIQVSRT